MIRGLVRGVGWVLTAAGLVVVLYLVYSLLFTNLETGRAQQRLLDDFTAAVDTAAAPGPSPTPTPTAAGPEPTAVPGAQAGGDPRLGGGADGDGDAVALIWFSRPGGDPPVTDERYVVVDGVALPDLEAGPGHYPQTAEPGGEGNFAVAGHRTTHGAPFFRLDDLREGDRVHVLATDGREHTYEVRRQQVVAPTALWVLGDDPIATGGPTITLTTCHPRFSNRQRLVAFGELVT